MLEAEIIKLELGEGDGATLSSLALVPQPILQLRLGDDVFVLLPKGVKRPEKRYEV